MGTNFAAKALLVLAALFPLCSSALAQRHCEGDFCIDVFVENGTLFGEMSSTNLSKASPGMFIVTPVDIGVEHFPILLSALPGAMCSGLLSPAAGTATTGGPSTSFVCTIDGANGARWRLTISITWVWNADLGDWQVEDMSAELKQVRKPNANQVQ